MPMMKSFWGPSKARERRRAPKSQDAQASPASPSARQRPEQQKRTTTTSGLARRVSDLFTRRSAVTRLVPENASAVPADPHPSLLRSSPAQSSSGKRQEKMAAPAAEQDMDHVALASRLAKAFNLDHFETRRIAKAWEKFRSAPTQQRTKERFGKFIGEIFDVESVNPATVEEAFQFSLRCNEICIDDFLEWYMRNMFTDVKNMNGRRSRLSREEIDTLISKECKVDAHTILSIRRTFDSYDLNKSGEIELDEFSVMMAKLMNAKEGDVTKGRLKQFWDEATEGGDDLNFYQFACWYTKNFCKNDNGVVGNMYDSYNPTTLRSRNVESANAAMRAEEGDRTVSPEKPTIVDSRGARR